MPDDDNRIFRMFALCATSIYSDPVTRDRDCDTPNHDAAIPTVNICPQKSLFAATTTREPEYPFLTTR